MRKSRVKVCFSPFIEEDIGIPKSVLPALKLQALSNLSFGCLDRSLWRYTDNSSHKARV